MTRIYFADLTHTTITISNDSFPLNIGLVASYLKSFYPDLEVSLFKYPDTLKKALDNELPDIIALSNYPWNRNLDLSFLKYTKAKNKKCITVMGGPNMTYDKKQQYDFLIKNQNILDFYCMYEGEVNFKNLFDSAIKHDFDLSKMKNDDIAGNIYLKGAPQHTYDIFLTTNYSGRMEDLEKIPSPYLNGMFDKFFDDKLSPLIETHRGCPFTCTYCHEGYGARKRVVHYSVDRIKQELDYIADHIGDKVHNLMFADPNFGMFDSHIGIAEKIKQVFDRTGYPQTIFASTGKNKKENLVKISQILDGISMPIWMSVQSMTDAVLKNIRRSNISIEQMIQVQKELELFKINSKSELILCLPGESYQTHLESVIKLMEMKMGHLNTYQLMLVNGSEMVESNVREVFGFQTKFRVIPRSITQLEGMERAVETEEIVVATNDMNFDDYLKARRLHLLISIFYNGKVFNGFFRIIEEYNLKLYDFVVKLDELFAEYPQAKEILDNFLQQTKDELYNSEEEIYEYYSDEENFTGFLNGEQGANLLHLFTSIFYMDKSEFLVEMISTAALALNNDPVFVKKVENIKQFYTYSFRYYLDSDRKSKNCDALFNYDINSWLESSKKLDKFYRDKPLVLVFYSPESNYDYIEDYFDRYGRNYQSLGKIMTRLWITEFMRKAKTI